VGIRILLYNHENIILNYTNILFKFETTHLKSREISRTLITLGFALGEGNCSTPYAPREYRSLFLDSLDKILNPHSTFELWGLKVDIQSIYMGIIYKIYCKNTQMSYIGKTIQNLNTRIKQHRDKSSYCRCLSTAISENGWENFEVSTLWEGDNSSLGDMERHYINELNTMEPNGYNIREGGGRSEKVSDISRQLMVDKQREISMRRNGLLGRIRPIYSKVDKDKITSYSLKVSVNGKTQTIGSYKTCEEALEVQKKYTEDPDNYEIPPPKRVGNGKSSNVYFCSDKQKKRWQVQFWVNGKNVSLGRYETQEEALEVANKYSEDTENFIKPNQIDKFKKDRKDVGVTFRTNENVWQSAFWNGKKNIFLGRYNTKEEAIDARKRYIDDPYNFVKPNQRKPIHNT